jgi:hypothetical protein
MRIWAVFPLLVSSTIKWLHMPKTRKQNMKLGLLLVAVLLCATLTRAFASAPAALQGPRRSRTMAQSPSLRQRAQQEYTRGHPGALGVRGGGAEGKVRGSVQWPQSAGLMHALCFANCVRIRPWNCFEKAGLVAMPLLLLHVTGGSACHMS